MPISWMRYDTSRSSMAGEVEVRASVGPSRTGRRQRERALSEERAEVRWVEERQGEVLGVGGLEAAPKLARTQPLPGMHAFSLPDSIKLYVSHSLCLPLRRSIRWWRSQDLTWPSGSPRAIRSPFTRVSGAWSSRHLELLPDAARRQTGTRGELDFSESFTHPSTVTARSRPSPALRASELLQSSLAVESTDPQLTPVALWSSRRSHDSARSPLDSAAVSLVGPSSRHICQNL